MTLKQIIMWYIKYFVIIAMLLMCGPNQEAIKNKD